MRGCMCEIALVGAQSDVSQLRSVLSARYQHDDLDLDAPPDPIALRAFPEGDGVVAVTLGGCSCSLLEGLGHADDTTHEAHLAGPGYAFRRALASAALRFGSIRLLIYRTGKPQPAPQTRSTTLGQLLRAGLLPQDALLMITV
jgi:hypothetical protein